MNFDASLRDARRLAGQSLRLRLMLLQFSRAEAANQLPLIPEAWCLRLVELVEEVKRRLRESPYELLPEDESFGRAHYRTRPRDGWGRHRTAEEREAERGYLMAVDASPVPVPVAGGAIVEAPPGVRWVKPDSFESDSSKVNRQRWR